MYNRGRSWARPPGQTDRGRGSESNNRNYNSHKQSPFGNDDDDDDNYFDMEGGTRPEPSSNIDKLKTNRNFENREVNDADLDDDIDGYLPSSKRIKSDKVNDTSEKEEEEEIDPLDAFM